MSRRKVLLVEDNPANMELAADLLEVAGFQVLRAPTAKVGIALARTEAPDAILMDIGLPDMDGLAAARTLKEDPRTKDIPVIATTSHAMKGDEGRILESGCDGYITKPIDTREFAKQVAGYLESEGR